MDGTILLFLLQDGITNGAIYALLALALVLVFAVTRVIFIPQGEFVTLGALTYALLNVGVIPGTIWLLTAFAALALAFELVALWRRPAATRLLRLGVTHIVAPAAIICSVIALAPLKLPVLVQALLTLVVVAPIGPYLHRFAYQPLAGASVLVLLIASVGAHFAMQGLLLLVFGPEGLRATPLSSASLSVGVLPVSGQSLAVYGLSIGLMSALALLFGRTIIGKALRATAVNRLGARLVGIPTALSGDVAFMLAAVIGALSGILIAPLATIYYDSGFLIGLKGFVAAIMGGLVSYPVAALAAIAVGIVEAFASFWASNFKEIIVFVLVIPVLIAQSLAAGHVEEEDE